MRVVLTYPIFDSRLLSPDAPPTTPRPDFSSRARHNEHLRGFGERSSYSISDHDIEAEFAVATNAIRLAPLPPFPLPANLKSVFGLDRLIVVGEYAERNRRSRRFLHDQLLTARVEVAFKLPHFRRPTDYRSAIGRIDSLILEHKLFHPILEHILDLKVTIAHGHGHAKELRLADAAPALARHYAKATTRRRGIDHEPVPSPARERTLCEPGAPLVVAALAVADDGRAMGREAVRTTLGKAAVDTFSATRGRRGIPIVTVRDPARGKSDARSDTLVTLMSRYHAVASCARLVEVERLKAAPAHGIEAVEETLRLTHRLRTRLRRVAGELARSGAAEAERARLSTEGDAAMLAVADRVWSDPALEIRRRLNRSSDTSGLIDRIRRLVMPAAPPVFLSYRRDDDVLARAVLRELLGRLKPEQVFFDHDSIPVGGRFPDILIDAIAASKVVVVVIGRNWLGQRDGRVRMADPDDWVRREIETAFLHGKLVLPVHDPRVKFPPAALPEALADLRTRNAVTTEQMDKLIDAVERAI